VLKKKIRRILEEAGLIKNRYLYFLYKYDRDRFADYSGMNNENSEVLASKMRLIIHSLEKGFCITDKKRDFGKEKIMTLIDLYEQYKDINEKKDQQIIIMVEDMLSKYVDYQKDKMDISFIPKEYIRKCNNLSGSFTLDADIYKKRGDFNSVAKSRHSVRAFEDGSINRDLISDAVRLAQTSPSACNRQSTRIHYCDDKSIIKKITKMHGGFNGFDNIAGVFVVAGELSLYMNEYERNTVFVDGGIFVMNLLYSLQYYGIASCPIIWGMEPSNDSMLYNMLHIKESEEIISLIAVGKFPDKGAEVACSCKRELDDVLSFC